MTFQYIPDHFSIQELVSEQVYADRGEKAWQLLDIRLLQTIDFLRIEYGPITINDWHLGGNNESRGLRMPESPYYSPYSQHSFGRAADLIFKNYTAEHVRNDIIQNPRSYAFTHINSYEEGTSWLHCDVRNVDRFLTFPGPKS